MNLNTFLNTLKTQPDTITFQQTLATIEHYYYFQETAFTNGNIKNKAGENSGSCQLFAFAQWHKLNQSQTLHCFGRYYRDDVLPFPLKTNHPNIRQFMLYSWQGIHFEKQPLQQK